MSRIEVPLARWLPHDTPVLVRWLCERALCDIGIVELTPNRSGVIDEYNKRTGAPVGSFWCASALYAWCTDVGVWVPSSAGASCDSWVRAAQADGRWVTHPAAGFGVFYHSATDPNDSVHCGLVVRETPVVLSVEANTSIGGGGVERNGTAVALKKVSTARVMGYVRLVP